MLKNSCITNFPYGLDSVKEKLSLFLLIVILIEIHPVVTIFKWMKT